MQYKNNCRLNCKRGKIRISIFILFQIFFYAGFAQNNTIPFYKVESLNGIPIGRITGISQSPDGILWFAGNGQNCLYRYDGNKLTVFKPDNNNPNSFGFKFPESVYADDRGLIWIGGGGLDLYNPGTGIFTHFRHNENDINSITKGNVLAILRDHKGNIWVGTEDGLDRLIEKTGKFIHYRNDSSNPKSLSNNWINTIYEDKRNVLWIGTGLPWNGMKGDGGLSRMNPDGSFTRYLHDPKNPKSLVSNKIRAIFEDSRGNFWVGTDGEGLHIMDREKGTFDRYLYNPKLPNELSAPPMNKWNGVDGISFISEDKSGAIWIGSYVEGLSRYDPVTKQMSRYRMGNGFPDSSTYRGFISRDGTLWVAPDADRSVSLYRADPGAKTIRKINTVNLVMRILADKGQIWVSTNGNGLLQYDENNILLHQFKHKPADPFSLINDTIYALYKNPGEDTLWIGTKHGIEIMNMATKKFSRFNPGKTGDSLHYRVTSVQEDKKANLWIGTLGGGLIRYNRKDGSLKQWLPDPADSTSLSSPVIPTLYLDREQNVWLGTWGEGRQGTWKLNPETGKFRNYLPGKTGRCFYEDQEGVFWASTNDGFFRYDRKADQFLPFFDSYSSVSNEMTVGIAEDHNNNLWLNTAKGIIKINRERNDFILLGKKYGITRPADIFIGDMCKTDKEQILAGNDNVFYAFFPAELDVDMKPLELSITDFFLNNASGSTAKDSSFQKSAENKSEIELASNQNNFGIKFSSNDYRSPESVRYYTLLENYDPVWHQSGLDNTVYYFNLSPGDYTFKVKAYNSEDQKGERQIRIHILPPWWKTGWAYAAYGLLLVMGIVVVSRVQRQRIIREERQKRQSFELAQAKEIEKAYTELKATQAQLIQSEKMASLGELTAGIAHEIQNPLNFVNNFSEVNMELAAELKEELSKMNIDIRYKNQLEEIAGGINENQEKILHHGQRADAIVKGMLQHSRISTGIKEPTDINQLVDEYLRLAYHGLRAKDKSFNTEMKTDLDPKVGKVNIIAQDIGRVLLNLYNNAFYTVAQKKLRDGSNYQPLVEVKTKLTGQKVEIAIQDNGDGIPKKVLDKIFQPFFTTKPAGQGTGLGLSISFDIVKAHGGDIKVHSVEGSHTTFIVSLPC